MAIHIKEIYLPEDPNEIIEFAVKGNGNVFVIGEHFALEACNVQEPHGRLIDADALMLKIREYTEEYGDMDENGWHSDKWCAMQEAKMAIADAPTVIPATEDG